MTGHTKPQPEYDIILFDGNCMLCSRIVRFVIHFDPKKRFRFAALASEAGHDVLERALAGGGSTQLHAQPGRSRSNGDANGGVPTGIERDRTGAAHPDTFMLVRGSRIYVKSRAGLEVVRRLRAPWPLLYALIVIPRPLRDRVYDYIARNRYRWFGQYDSCMLPTPDNKERFIE
jgi:predicted DCC family thiol-disulfide oxidoreductase YuxK